MNVRPISFALVCLLSACDDKGAAKGGPAASASAAASAAPTASAAPSASASASAAPEASAAPSSSTSASGANTVTISPDTKDVSVTVRDPIGEPQKTVKLASGATLTVYLPDFPGTVWGLADPPNRALGKVKEEVIPGFAGPSTPGHQFTWVTKPSPLKAGQTQKVVMVNKKGGKPTPTTFTLTVEPN